LGEEGEGGGEGESNSIIPYLGSAKNKRKLEMP